VKNFRERIDPKNEKHFSFILSIFHRVGSRVSENGISLALDENQERVARKFDYELAIKADM
jgi:hypothetical protein